MKAGNSFSQISYSCQGRNYYYTCRLRWSSLGHRFIQRRCRDSGVGSHSGRKQKAASGVMCARSGHTRTQSGRASLRPAIFIALFLDLRSLPHSSTIAARPCPSLWHFVTPVTIALMGCAFTLAQGGTIMNGSSFWITLYCY